MIMLLFYPTVLQGVAALNAKITKCDAVSHIGEKSPNVITLNLLEVYFHKSRVSFFLSCLFKVCSLRR